MTPTSHVGAVSLFALLAWSVKVYVDPSKSYVELTLPVVNLHVAACCSS